LYTQAEIKTKRNQPESLSQGLVVHIYVSVQYKQREVKYPNGFLLSLPGIRPCVKATNAGNRSVGASSSSASPASIAALM
jgi:hypothetical protein